MGPFRAYLSAVVSALALAACSSSVTPPTEHLVDVSWSPSRDSGVNRPGGGYRVEISGKAPIDVPYVSGLTAPTFVSTTLWSGTYSVSVRAYGALDAQGGTTGTLSAPSTRIVEVP